MSPQGEKTFAAGSGTFERCRVRGDKSVAAPIKNMTALDKLKKLTAWESDPALTEDELEEILESVGIPDSEGYGHPVSGSHCHPSFVRRGAVDILRRSS